LNAQEAHYKLVPKPPVNYYGGLFFRERESDHDSTWIVDQVTRHVVWERIRRPRNFQVGQSADDVALHFTERSVILMK
jgi:hypothetical protein